MGLRSTQGAVTEGPMVMRMAVEEVRAAVSCRTIMTNFDVHCGLRSIGVTGTQRVSTALAVYLPSYCSPALYSTPVRPVTLPLSGRSKLLRPSPPRPSAGARVIAGLDWDSRQY
jgi:hypothetical protein